MKLLLPGFLWMFEDFQCIGQDQSKTLTDIDEMSGWGVDLKVTNK